MAQKSEKEYKRRGEERIKEIPNKRLKVCTKETNRRRR